VLPYLQPQSAGVASEWSAKDWLVQPARVVVVGEGWVEVETAEATPGCHDCPSTGTACALGRLVRWRPQQPLRLRIAVDAGLSWREGEAVQVRVRAWGLMRLLLVLFLLPLVLLLMGAGFAAALGFGTFGQFVAAAAGLGFAYAWLRFGGVAAWLVRGLAMQCSIDVPGGVGGL